MGTGTGGAKQSSGIETKGASPYVNGLERGEGNADPKETTNTSAFLSTLRVTGAFSSCAWAEAIFLHIEQGCLPSKVFVTASAMDPVREKSFIIPAHATLWSMAQCPPAIIKRASAITMVMIGRRTFIAMFCDTCRKNPQ